MTISKSIRLTDKVSIKLDEIKLEAKREQQEYLSQQVLIEKAVTDLVASYEKGTTIDDLVAFKYNRQEA